MTMQSEIMDWNFARMIEHKAHLTIGSDWAGSPPPSLFEHCADVLTDIDNATGGRGGQTLCKMLTLNGAEAVGRSDQVGSIAVGKKANFVVLSQDLSRGEFRGAKVKKTWFEGELVFEDV